MRIGVLLFSSIVALSCATAPRAVESNPGSAVGVISVSAIDPSIDEELELGMWLQQRALNGIVAWERNDCGEQTGDARSTRASVPTCVEAAFLNCAGRKTTISFVIGESSDGVPHFYWGRTVGVDGEQSFRSLAELGDTNPRCVSRATTHD